VCVCCVLCVVLCCVVLCVCCVLRVACCVLRLYLCVVCFSISISCNIHIFCFPHSLTHSFEYTAAPSQPSESGVTGSALSSSASASEDESYVPRNSRLKFFEVISKSTDGGSEGVDGE
jgi:hypothetical protein